MGRCDLVVSYRLWVDRGAGSMLSRLAVCRGEDLRNFGLYF